MMRSTRNQFFLLLITTLFSNSIAGDTLTLNQSLPDGETLVSSAGRYALGFFSPPNSKNRYVGIWYNNIPTQTVVWVANRQNPVTVSTASLTIAVNGTLIVRNNTNSTVFFWSSSSTSATNPIARLLDNGNFIVRESNGNDIDGFLWQSFDHPTDTLLPGMQLGSSQTTGLNCNLTSWKGDDDPSPGDYTIALDAHGDPQLTMWTGPVKKWRSGPWNGLRFTGLSALRSVSLFNFSFVHNQEETFYSYYPLNESIITRLVVNQTGTFQRFVWTGTWTVFFYTPASQCDHYAVCGPYGSCDPNGSPICTCLQGFKPKSPQDWNLMDTSGGCVRKTVLDCRNGTDGFVTVSLAELPDTSNATVSSGMSLDQCRAVCFSNCSCTGYASADASGIGCIIWASELIDLQVLGDGGQNLYLRLARADLVGDSSRSDQSHMSGQATIAIVVSVVVGACLIVLVGFLIWRRKNRRRAMLGTPSFTAHYSNEGAQEKDFDLPLLDLATVAAAANNFSFENKLGEGGFGPVYKGKLREGQEIAVKRLAKTSIQGLDEFKNEVMLIAKLQHRNLVRLLGCCIQGEERMLIYEYMPNKSLDLFLFDKAKGSTLDWKTRYDIILGIARGLLYLHQDSRFRIIHRDLKASNVLLDKEMNPKISDFGMARIFGGDETGVNTRRVVGTYGYMSPEYAMDGIFSMKSDVFSFGVLVLEIISGRRNRGVYLSEPHLNLLGHAWSLWKEGNGMELLDESMGYSLSKTEVLRCIKIGLLCVQERPEERPTMSTVVLMLRSDMSLPHPKQPGFVSARGPLEIDSSSSQQTSCAVNDITITMFEGR